MHEDTISRRLKHAQRVNFEQKKNTDLELGVTVILENKRTNQIKLNK